MRQHTVTRAVWIRSLGLLCVAVPCAVALALTPGCGSSSSSGATAGASNEAGAAGASDPGQAGDAGEAGEAGGALVAATEEEMFGALGVDTRRTPRTYVGSDDETHELGDDYNPLGRGVKSLQPISEIYFAGRTLTGKTGNQFLLDELPGKKPLELTDSADSWSSNQFSRALAADLDGDGVDEVVNVYYIEASHELHANVIRCTEGCDGNGGKFAKVADTQLDVQDASKVPLDRHWFSHGLTAADTDGDGRQEIVIGNFGGLDVCAADDAGAFTCKAKVTKPNWQKVSLARGRFSDDPAKTNDDLVVAFSDGTVAWTAFYDGSPDAFASNATTNAKKDPRALAIKFLDQTALYTYEQAFVTAGDIDQDGRDEVVLAAHRPSNEVLNGEIWDLVLLDDANVSYRPFSAFRLPLGPGGGAPCAFPGALCDSTANTSNNLFHPALQVFTKHRQPTLEKAIYAGAYVIDNLAELLLSDADAFPAGKDITNKLQKTLVGFYEVGGGGWNHAPNEVVTGDIDGSGSDSIVALWDETLNGTHDAFTPSTLASMKWDDQTGKWSAWKTFATTSGGPAVSTGGYDSTYGVGLALPNVDRDSPIVEYRGDHELLFGTPRVLAVLAAAPFFAGANGDASSTSISFGKGTGFEENSTIGLRTATSIGYEAPSLFGTTKLEWTLTFGASLDWISSSTVTLDQTQTWTAGKEDAVVFQVVPFDVYYYEVVSSPDAGDVGNTVSINVPRKMSTYKVPVELYNRSILNGPKIGSALLQHTVGDPASYPRSNTCAKAGKGGKFGDTTFLVGGNSWCYASADTLHVGVGTGSVGFTIARTQSSAKGVNTDLSVDFEVVAGVGGFSVGQSVGFHWGYGYSVDTSESYSFSGQVGDLPDTKRGYDFGLVAHRGMLAGVGTDYPVFLVDYWVENVKE